MTAPVAPFASLPRNGEGRRSGEVGGGDSNARPCGRDGPGRGDPLAHYGVEEAVEPEMAGRGDAGA